MVASARALSSVGEQIQSTAAGLEPARLVLAVLAVPLLAVGWLACWVWRVVWAVASWSWAAVLVGWRYAAAARDDADGGG